MIRRLLNIQFARLKRQKIVYLFFVVMAVMIISNALGLAGSFEDHDMSNFDTENFAADYYAVVNFQPCVCSSYVDIVGTLFLSLSAQY